MIETIGFISGIGFLIWLAVVLGVMLFVQISKNL